MHVNVGHLCQFHTASPAHESYIAAEGPQIWRGTMTIAFRHDQLLATVARLRTMALEAPLVGTHCAVLPAPDGLSYKATCPYGNKFLLTAASAHEIFSLAPPSGAARPGSLESKALGLTCISLPCAKGTSGRIGDFYERCLGVHTARFPSKVEMWGGPGGCQKIEFFEIDSELPRYTGDHFCIYLADLKTRFEKCRAAGVVWVNPRFLHLDETRTWDECVRYKQFRLKHITDLDGCVLYEQEHEIRMAEHSSYPLPLTTKMQL